MSGALVAIEDLHRRFETAGRLDRLLRRARPLLDVLHGVTLDIAAGEWLALVGSNGAGKTTLLRIVAGLLAPTSGSVRVCGVDVAGAPRAVRAAVGYVLADARSFHWRLNARENMEFFAALEGVPSAERASRIAELLRQLDLDEVADRPFAEFSSGMKQRLAVARALLRRPPVMLMDEPTRDVDTEHARQLWQVVRDHVDDVEGCVLFVTHQPQEALSLCGRIGVLERGTVTLHSTEAITGGYLSDLDGITISVRDLSEEALASLRRFRGVRDILVATSVAGEQVLQVQTENGDLPLAGFIGELTGTGATVSSLQRGSPLRAFLDRLPGAPAGSDQP